jgi:hypothetical protein
VSIIALVINILAFTLCSYAAMRLYDENRKLGSSFMVALALLNFVYVIFDVYTMLGGNIK